VAQVPFSRGVSFIFQTSSAQQIQYTRFTKTDCENAKTSSCDARRLPISLHDVTSGIRSANWGPLNHFTGYRQRLFHYPAGGEFLPGEFGFTIE
jgi:hypothetical protein